MTEQEKTQLLWKAIRMINPQGTLYYLIDPWDSLRIAVEIREVGDKYDRETKRIRAIVEDVLKEKENERSQG